MELYNWKLVKKQNIHKMRLNKFEKVNELICTVGPGNFLCHKEVIYS